MFGRLLARAFIINRLRALWPKGYQRGSLRKSHQNGEFLKDFLKILKIFLKDFLKTS